MKNLIYIMGKSCSGKSYIGEKIYNLFNHNLVKIAKPLLYTTRPKRSEEDSDYIFLSKKDFMYDYLQGSIEEFRTYDFYTFDKDPIIAYYGTGKLSKSVDNYLIIGTPGTQYETYKNKYSDAIIPVYVYASDHELIKRSENRLFDGKSKEEITSIKNNPLSYREVYRRLFNDNIDFEKLDSLLMDNLSGDKSKEMIFKDSHDIIFVNNNDKKTNIVSGLFDYLMENYEF